jgi:hypothetical protein
MVGLTNEALRNFVEGGVSSAEIGKAPKRRFPNFRVRKLPMPEEG